MAWIVVVPPSPRHPHERYQVCYQEGKRQRSAGIFPTKRRALAEQRAIERGRDELVKDHEMDLERARTLFGDYVATKWWPAWKDQHPTSEYGTRKKVEKRILPTFGDIPLIDLDASTIGAWKSAMLAEQLSPQTVNTYLSLLGTILNAAVDDDYLARSPWCARAAPAAPPPPATSQYRAARSGCSASSSTSWSRPLTRATGR
jgi:Phage integrase SAM-like domain